MTVTVLSADRPVLVIEDDQDVRELVVDRLALDGYRVVGVRTGEEGMDRAEADPPRVVVLDLLLPGIDGWEVIRRLRAHEHLGETPVIVMSVTDHDPDSGRVDAYIAKPFDLRHLRHIVAELGGAPREAA